MEATIVSYIVFWAMVVALASASDPSPLQDFCIAVNDSKTAGTYPFFSFEIKLEKISFSCHYKF